MPAPRPVVATGQQIGAGWTPALSVIKALAALREAQRIGGEAVFWMADEDHDHAEVAATVALEGDRLRRHRFRFGAPAGTITGRLPWHESHQREAEGLWGSLPEPAEPTLRGHFLALGESLWRRGLRPYSPTDPSVRVPVQAELERWRALGLEADLARRAEDLRRGGESLPLDPAAQHAWFSLDPGLGLRRPLGPGEPCPAGAWLSPGALIRPLLQSLLLPVDAVVLGPAERAYWRLTEPLWERVGLQPPRILPRPSVFVLPKGLSLDEPRLEALRAGDWAAFRNPDGPPPSASAGSAPGNPAWGEALNARAASEWMRYRQRLQRLDARALRDGASRVLGFDAERSRQKLFPFHTPQERVLPGLFWLREEALLDRITAALDPGRHLILVEAP